MGNNTKALHELKSLLLRVNATWTTKDNLLFKLSDKEKRRRLGYVPGPDEPSLEQIESISKQNYDICKSESSLLKVSIPKSFDWRNVNGRNFITPVKDQITCGACVAFGVVATLESSARITCNIAVNGPGSLPYLSEAQLFFCNGRKCDYGWSITPAMNYAQNTGVTVDKCFQYSDHDQPCNLGKNWDQMITQISKYHVIENITEMKNWLSTRGPLVARFNVYSDFFAYGSGVYRHVTGNSVGGHCVCCVGYSDDLNAWLCKNSWDDSWGDKSGYFWIGYGECGIDASVVCSR